MSLATLKSDLSLVQGKIREIFSTGQEYIINGSHSVKNPLLSDLRNQERYLKNQIYKYNGYTGRTRPDFS